MKAYALSLGFAVAGLLLSCSKEEAPTEAASAEVAASAAAPAEASVKLAGRLPRIGGSVAAVGEHAVELKLHRSGSIEAVVTNAAGELVGDGASLSVTAPLEGGAREETKLAFSKPRGRFEGRCKGKLASGNVDIALEHGGRATGKLADAVVVHGPEVGGNVMVAGVHGAEVFVHPGGEVRAFVRDRAGAEVGADANLDVKAKVRGAAGASEDVSLAFDAPHGCFVGKAKAELSPGPLELFVAAKGAADAGLGRLEKVSLVADASHGGEVIVAGDYSAEVVLDGKAISVFVFDASGKASADANLDVKVDFGGDAASSLALKWDPVALGYRASLAGGADFDAKPIRVSIGTAGALFAGGAASLRAAVDARLKAAGKLDARADARAKLRGDLDAKAKLDVPQPKANVGAKGAAKVSVQAPNVNVQAPKVNVQQQAKTGANADGKASAKGKASIKLGL